MNSLTIPLRWICLKCPESDAYRFPSRVNSSVRKWYSRPGIYRWAILDVEGRLIEAYVGETESIFNRLNQYIRPGKTQQTNLRLNSYLQNALARGSKLEYQVLEFDNFRVNGVIVSPESLSDPYIRKLIEAFAISDLRADGCKILNLGRDSLDKQISRALTP